MFETEILRCGRFVDLMGVGTDVTAEDSVTPVINSPQLYLTSRSPNLCCREIRYSINPKIRLL
jgi:hypothetical protein